MLFLHLVKLSLTQFKKENSETKHWPLTDAKAGQWHNYNSTNILQFCMWCELRNTCTEPEATMTRVTSWGMVEDVRLGNWNQSLPVVAKRSPSVFWRRREEALILSFPKGTEWQWCQSCASQKTTHLAVPFTTRAECMTQKCVINVNKSADIDRGKFDTAAAMTTLLNKIHEGIKKKKIALLILTQFN